MLFSRLVHEPGRLYLWVALATAVVLYAATLGYGVVGYDDHWLVQDNWILQQPSWSSLRAIFFDLEHQRRFVLGSEYLPIRDLSVMLDVAIWGTSLEGFHITNLVLYLSSIALWFAALVGYGIDRRIAGIAILLWAVHPTHAESVAWLAERKGLLAVAFSGAVGLGLARYRVGRSPAWLVMSLLAAVAAVWSKAPAAFAIGCLAALELVAPASRVSWRRSIVGLASVAVVAALAFVPVVLVASSTSVIGEQTTPFGRVEAVLGTHGFYIALAAMVQANSVSYPIATEGPSAGQVALGAVALVLLVGAALAPNGRRFSPPAPVRAGALIWLFGWLPVSHAIIPVRTVFVADRYLLFATLGLSLIAASVLATLPTVRAQRALLLALVAAAAMRTWDARGNWRDSEALWLRAVTTNPADGGAWSLYAEAAVARGDPARALEIVAEGRTYSQEPRLIMRHALLELQYGARDRGLVLMREAAASGDYRALANLALLLLDDGNVTDALQAARAATQSAPLYVAGQRAHGKVALAAGNAREALHAFEQAYALEPQRLDNRFNLALALLAEHRFGEARPHLEACLRDPALGVRARMLLDQRR